MLYRSRLFPLSLLIISLPAVAGNPEHAADSAIPAPVYLPERYAFGSSIEPSIEGLGETLFEEDEVDPALSELQGPRSFMGQLIYDTGYILAAPTRWDREDWARAGLAAAVIAGIGAFDKPESAAATDLKTGGTTRLAKDLEPFGQQYAPLTLLAFYGIGKIADDPRSTAIGEDGLMATVTTNLVTLTLKQAGGRKRPRQTSNASKFDPFGGDHSFPSGHTAQAFTLASVISAHYDSPWIDAAAYSVAALVGYSRHESNAHWGSDIAAGAMIGYAIGHSVVALNGDNRGPGISIDIEAGPGLILTIPF